MDNLERSAVILKALGHPLRLQIVAELRREGEACVCHLEHCLGQRQATISQQLARLREAGLVIDRRAGMNVYYALADESIPAVVDTARAAAVALAPGRERRRTVRPLAEPATSVCPCPRCQGRSYSNEPETLPEANRA